MFHDLHDAVILKLPGNEGDYVPGAWLVHPAEGVYEEQYIVPTKLLDCLSNLGVGVAFFKYFLSVQQIAL